LIAGLVLSSPSLGQGDAIMTALNRCNDPANAAALRISNCMSVINARGIDQDEIAFAWLDLGLAYQAQGNDREHELAAYTKAIELQPALWQARANRAMLYLEAGDGEHAFTDYLALRDNGPDKVSLYRGKGTIEYRTTKVQGTTQERSNMDVPGREEDAYRKSMDVIGTALDKGLSTRCRARALAGLELDAAARDCDSALQINPADESAHHARGLIAFRRADWATALKEFNTVLAENAKAAESLYMKGIAERRMGNAPAGDADITAAISMDPRVGDVYAQVGILR